MIRFGWHSRFGSGFIGLIGFGVWGSGFQGEGFGFWGLSVGLNILGIEGLKV